MQGMKNNNPTRQKPRLNTYNGNESTPTRSTRVGSVRDYQDKKNSRYRNKNVPSKRKISLGKKKDKVGKYNTFSQKNRNPHFVSSNQQLIPKKLGGGNLVVKKHPRPNSPPPLPTNLKELNDLKRKEKEDLDFMKNTLKNESEGKEEPEEYFNFQEKVEYILDLQEDIMNLHLSAIREDAQMLKKESEIISNARNNEADYEIDNYIKDTEDIVRKKLMLYKQIADKIKLAKKALAEEEEYSRKMKNFMYY